MTIWRNDDISYKTDVAQFEEVHKLFKKYTVLHTIALIVKDISKNQVLIDFINLNNIDVQIHCWEHYDLTQNTEQLKKDLPKCIHDIAKYFNHGPDTLYPPWNKSSVEVEQIAMDSGLTVSNKKVSLSQYIRFEGDPGCDVINFHSWALEDIVLLEDALKIYVSKR